MLLQKTTHRQFISQAPLFNSRRQPFLLFFQYAFFFHFILFYFLNRSILFFLRRVHLILLSIFEGILLSFYHLYINFNIF